MKKAVALFLSVLMIFSLAACANKTAPSNSSTPDVKAVPSDSSAPDVKAAPSDKYDEEYTIHAGDSDEWTPFESGSGVTFVNNNSDVIGITDDGKKVTFKGLAVGEADITATCDGKTARALVYVLPVVKLEFTGVFEYNPPTDNFCFEVKLTENGESYTDTYAKIGSEEARIYEYSDWQEFLNTETEGYYVVVDGEWCNDPPNAYYTFEETGLGAPFDSFASFVQILSSLGFGNENLGEFYAGEETFLGVKCWVFDVQGYNNIYSKYWVDPSNGCTLKHVGTKTDKVCELTRYDLNYTVWDSYLVPN